MAEYVIFRLDTLTNSREQFAATDVITAVHYVTETKRWSVSLKMTKKLNN